MKPLRFVARGGKLRVRSLANLEPMHIRDVASTLAGATLGSPVRVEGGANNQVYKLSGDSAEYALKLYISKSGDLRDRLGAEYGALKFLSDHGVTSVPRPLAIDREHNLALYEWMDGEQVTTIQDEDISVALDFVRTLHELRNADGAETLALASEACISPAELVRQIEGRLETLKMVSHFDKRLESLINVRMTACLDAATARARQYCATCKQAFDADLAMEKRTLSPSDFGFHNARRNKNGRIFFLDLEYFGWDEPAKLGAEFVMHPGMSLTHDQKCQFVRGTDEIYGSDLQYQDRMRALFPLFALRWCLIALNEFLPDRWSRRITAWQSADRDSVLDQQLQKSLHLLSIAESGIEKFPYDS